MKPQAIAGVSAGTEREIEIVYPSIAATGLGKLIGSICDSIPVRILGVKLSAILFALPLAPLALLPYGLQKLFGKKYVLTNRAVRIQSFIGERLFQEVALGQIDEIAVSVSGGQGFYNAGDVQLLNAAGDTIATLEGVSRPARFRQIVLDVRAARTTSDASLATIEGREPQPA